MQSQIKLVDPAKAKAYFQDKIDFTTGPVEVSRMLKEGALINVVDVRDAEDFEKGHIHGSINLPQDRWSTLDGLTRDKTNILVCYSQQCHLAAKAAVYFAERGYPVMEMDGGFEAWKENDLDVEGESVNRLKGLFHKKH
jgi:rhodanese-related sulfurtransferase